MVIIYFSFTKTDHSAEINKISFAVRNSWNKNFEKSLPVQVFTVSIVAMLATIGVYGIVAIIVRMDDARRQLIKHFKDKGFFSVLGRLLIRSLPVIIKMLAVVGTVALILVSSGIFIHNIKYLHDLLPQLPMLIREFLFGILGGLLTIGFITVGGKVFSLLKSFSKSPQIYFLFGLLYLASCTVPDKASLQVMNETRKLRKSPIIVKAYRSGKLTHDKLELRMNNSFSYESNVAGTQKSVFYAGTFTKNGDTLVMKFQDNHKYSLWTGNAIIDTSKNEITILAIDPAYNKEMTITKPK